MTHTRARRRRRCQLVNTMYNMYVYKTIFTRSTYKTSINYT